ncbi:hypothetical protein D3C86_1155700 [compost metagenome]
MGLTAFHEGRDQRGHPGRIAPEAADADDRVEGVARHVRDRREDPVDPDRESLAGGPGAELVSKLGRLRGPEGHGRRKGAQPLDLLPGPVLHVGGDQKGQAADGLEGRDPLARLGGLAVKEDVAAPAVAFELQGDGLGVIGAIAQLRAEEGRADELSDRRLQAQVPRGMRQAHPRSSRPWSREKAGLDYSVCRACCAWR